MNNAEVYILTYSGNTMSDDTVVVGAFSSEDEYFSYIQKESSNIIENELSYCVRFYIYQSIVDAGKLKFIKSISVEYSDD